MPESHYFPLVIEIQAGEHLSPKVQGQVEALCSAAYEEDMAATLAGFTGARHVLGWLEGRLVSHALWVTRYLQAGAGPLLRTAYVEAVATLASHRRRGYATLIMQHLVEAVSDYELAGLSPFSVGYYARLGWEAWRGPLFVRTPGGRLRSPNDECVMILRLPKTPPLDLDGPLSVEWRDGEIW